MKKDPVCGLALAFIMLALGIYADENANTINAKELEKTKTANNACIPCIKENIAAKNSLGPGQ